LEPAQGGRGNYLPERPFERFPRALGAPLERELPLRLAADFLAPLLDLRAPAFLAPLFFAPRAFLAAGRALLAFRPPDLLPEDFEELFETVFPPPLDADLVGELELILLVPVATLRPVGAELLPYGLRAEPPDMPDPLLAAGADRELP
jgi:hypothetical protein